jgi:hypothetical protein
MKILRGTVFGGIAYFLLGWLAWGILFMDFMSTHMNQCANRPGGEMIWWAMIVSSLASTLLLTIFMNGLKVKKITDGLLSGALFGVIFASVIDFSFWSMTLMFSNFAALLVDILISAVVYAIVGMVIMLTWGKEK